MARREDDPYGRFNFIVEVEGLEAAGFSEVSGLTSEIEPIEYRNGNEDITVRKLPGLVKYANITLKRGVTRSLELWQWYRAVVNGQVERRTGRIVLLDEARQPVRHFTFINGWPVRWEGPALNAKSSEVAIEVLEIAHEGLDIE